MQAIFLNSMLEVSAQASSGGGGGCTREQHTDDEPILNAKRAELGCLKKNRFRMRKEPSWAASNLETQARISPLSETLVGFTG
jgi:hypothetical protein